MRIERHRIGVADAFEEAARRGRQRRKSAVGAVHVQPEIVRARHVGNCADRVHRSRSGGPGARHHAEGQMAGRAVLAYQAIQIRHVHTQVRARLHAPHIRRADPQHGRRLADGEVSLFRRVEAHARLAKTVAHHIARSLRAARRGDAGKVRHRSAAHQQSRAVGGIAQHLLEPADAKQLHLGGRRPAPPAGHVDIERRRDHASHRRRRQPRGRDVTEKSRMAVVPAELLHHVAHRVQQFRKGLAAGRRGFVEPPPQLGGSAGAHHRACSQRIVVFGYEIEGGAAHFPDLGRRSYQRVRQSARVTGIPAWQNLHTRFEASGSFTW